MENLEIAECYRLYTELKSEKIKEREAEWRATITKYLTEKDDPAFIKSGNNSLYDLRNRQRDEKF